MAQSVATVTLTLTLTQPLQHGKSKRRRHRVYVARMACREGVAVKFEADDMQPCTRSSLGCGGKVVGGLMENP